MAYKKIPTKYKENIPTTNYENLLNQIFNSNEIYLLNENENCTDNLIKCRPFFEKYFFCTTIENCHLNLTEYNISLENYNKPDYIPVKVDYSKDKIFLYNKVIKIYGYVFMALQLVIGGFTTFLFIATYGFTCDSSPTDKDILAREISFYVYNIIIILAVISPLILSFVSLIRALDNPDNFLNDSQVSNIKVHTIIFIVYYMTVLLFAFIRIVLYAFVFHSNYCY